MRHTDSEVLAMSDDEFAAWVRDAEQRNAYMLEQLEAMALDTDPTALVPNEALAGLRADGIPAPAGVTMGELMDVLRAWLTEERVALRHAVEKR
jgi:hypothetical protein